MIFRGDMKNTREKPVVGQTVYLRRIKVHSRNVVNEKLEPHEVTAVGRKYFTVGSGYSALQFRLNDWSEKTDYSPSFRVYASERDFNDETEATALGNFLRAKVAGFGPLSLTLGQLRRIHAILQETEE